MTPAVDRLSPSQIEFSPGRFEFRVASAFNEGLLPSNDSWKWLAYFSTGGLN